MSQAVDLEVFYPHPPERVWQVLTDRRALAAWMMENNFEPKLGHKFQFYSRSLPGLKTTIHCEVVALEQPTRLVYTWRESPTAEPSLVVWTLTTVEGGTQLHLKHHQYSYTTAVAALDRSGATNAKSSFQGSTHFHHYSELFYSEYCNSSSTAATLEVSALQPFLWDYYLNQTLPKVLAQDETTQV